MTITDVSSIYGNLSTTDSTSTALTDSATDVGGDFDTFLQMLTTQIQNQDPLNPDDPTDFATQLAQFSAVEQSVLTNDLLEQVVSALTVGDDPTSQMGNWIGKDALVQSDVYYQGEEVTIKPLISSTADSAQFVVKNANGTEVLRTDLDPGQSEVIWGGADNTGSEVAEGYYTVSVESYLGGELIATETGLTFAQVSEVRVIDNQLVLGLQDGTEILASDAYGMRETL